MISAVRRAYLERTRERRLALSKEYEAANRERRLQKKRERYAANAERERELARQRRIGNPEKSREATKRYARANPHVVHAGSVNRRTKLKRSTPCWSSDEFDLLVKKEASLLAKMRKAATGFDWHVDHIEPLQGKDVSGFHVWNNLQVIPAKVNFSKRQPPNGVLCH